jgi:hypothetical protein
MRERAHDRALGQGKMKSRRPITILARALAFVSQISHYFRVE